MKRSTTKTPDVLRVLDALDAFHADDGEAVAGAVGPMAPIDAIMAALTVAESYAEGLATRTGTTFDEIRPGC